MYWFLSIPIAVLCGQLRNSQSLSFGPTLSPPEQRWPPSTGHRLIASVISNSCYPTMNLIVHLFNPFLSSRSKRICLFCPPMDNSSITTYTLGHYIYWGLAKLSVKWRHRQIQLTWCSEFAHYFSECLRQFYGFCVLNQGERKIENHYTCPQITHRLEQINRHSVGE